MKPAVAASRHHFVHWMTPEKTGAMPASPGAPSGGAIADSMDGGADGDAGFANNGFITYQGGPVITQLKVAAVFWGSNVDPDLVSGIPKFYNTLATGSFMHYVSEYATPTQTPGAYGTALGAFTIQPNNTNTVLLDADFITELSHQIASGVLPPNDANTVYMVHLPPGISVNDPKVGQSCVPSGFCAYHKSGSGIIYGVMPDFSQGGCAPGPPNCTSCCGDKSPFEVASAISSHELMEAITDPLPLDNAAWVSPLAGGEVGDLCEYSKNGHAMYTAVYARDGTMYTAQKGFSNKGYVQGFGLPFRGCVDYPTTLCCNDSQPNCLWLPNGTQNCPNPTGSSPNASTVPNGIVIIAPTLGGFGNATASVTRQPIHLPYPTGITDLLGGPGATSPTIDITSDTALVGASTACFAYITDATQKGMVQCVPDSPSFPCAALKGKVQQTPNGPQCCITLQTEKSVDGTQLCARFPVLGQTVIDLPAMPRWVALVGGALLVGLGAFAARKKRSPQSSVL